MWMAFQSQSTSADAKREADEAEWWKLYESALAVVGAVSDELLEDVQAATAEGRESAFDLSRVFSSVVPRYLTASGELLPRDISTVLY